MILSKFRMGAWAKLGAVSLFCSITCLQAAPQEFDNYRNSIGNDNFYYAAQIWSNNGISFPTDIYNYGYNDGEPSPFYGGHSAWWKWTAPSDGWCTVDTRGILSSDSPVKDTMLGVFTGTAVNSLTRIAFNDDHSSLQMFNDGRLSSATFYARTGVTYHIAVDAYSPSDVTVTERKVTLRLRHVEAKNTQRTAAFVNSKISDYSGLITLSLTAKGSYSAKVNVCGKTFSAAGPIPKSGFVDITVTPPPLAGVEEVEPFTVLIDLAGDMTFSIDQQGYIDQGGLLEREVFTQSDPNPCSGYYTSSMDIYNGAGAGYLTAKIAANGSVSGSILTPDGVSMAFKSTLRRSQVGYEYWLPVYVVVAKGQNVLAGNLLISDGGDFDFIQEESVVYVRGISSSPKKTLYPDGLTDYLTIDGTTYFKPGKDERIMYLLSQEDGAGLLKSLCYEDETLTDFELPFNLSSANKVVFNDLSRKPSLKLNPATGVVTGSILDDVGVKRTIKGIISQNRSYEISLKGQISGAVNTHLLFVEPDL